MTGKYQTRSTTYHILCSLMGYYHKFVEKSLNLLRLPISKKPLKLIRIINTCHGLFPLLLLGLPTCPQNIPSRLGGRKLPTPDTFSSRLNDLRRALFDCDELSFAFNNMHEFSAVDGFAEITENLAEMIKYVANEPSVGLFYVQQHTHNAVPNVVSLKNNVTEKSHETVLHAEDTEDSITMVKSMKDCGYSIADDMIKDIRISLAQISEKQPRRGLVRNSNSGFEIGRTSSWGPTTWRHNGTQLDTRKNSNYFSSVFRTAKEKASNFKWPPLDLKESTPTPNEKLRSHPNPLNLVASTSTAGSSVPDAESDEQLPLSSHAADELQEKDEQVTVNLSHTSSSPVVNYDEFKADKEAKLEEWLERTNQTGSSDKLQDEK